MSVDPTTTPETPADGPRDGRAQQQVRNAVAALLDADTDLVAQLGVLPAPVIAQVQHHLSTAATSGPGPDVHGATPTGQEAPRPAATLLEQLTDHVLEQLGRPTLGSADAEALNTTLVQLASGKEGQSLQTVIATSRTLPFLIEEMRGRSTRARAQRRRRAQVAGSPTLAVLAGRDVPDPRGEVAMSGYATSNRAQLLWTTGVGGCLAVAVLNGTSGFLAHFDPGQLNADPHPHDPTAPTTLDAAMEVIRRSVPLNGASFWFSSPSLSTGYVDDMRQRLLAAGARSRGEFTSDRLALRVTDGTVFTLFRS